MKRLVFIVLSIAVATLLFNCSSNKNLAKRLDRTWKVYEIYSMEVVRSGSDVNDRFTVRFDNSTGRINGTADCNSYFGTFNTTGTNGLSIDVAGASRMMCPNQTLEDEFIKALNETTSFVQAVNELVLLNREGKALIRATKK